MSWSRTGCANDHYHGRTIIDISISRRLFGHDEKKKDEKSKTLYDLIWEAAFCLYLVFTTCFGPQLKRQSNTVFSAEGRGLFMRSISLTRVPLAGRLQVEKIQHCEAAFVLVNSGGGLLPIYPRGERLIYT